MGVLSLQSDWIEPAIELDVCTDQSDNRFLECAVSGKAAYLVTKNIRHFPWKEYSGIKIVRVREFLKVLEALEKSRQREAGSK